MNREAFDQNIDLTLQHYREESVRVKLLAARSTAAPIPRSESMSVTVGVTMLVAHLPRYADTWYYVQRITRTTEPHPSGMRAIDPARLIGICAAAENLPPDVALSETAVELYWPMLPAVGEPTYHFHTHDASTVIGAYSSTLYSDWSIQRQLSALVPMLS